MKVKLSEIIVSKQPLVELQGLELPIKVSYWIKKVNDKCLVEISRFEEMRNELVVKFGKEDKVKKGSFFIDPESKNFKEFGDKIQELIKIEVDLEGIEQINIKDLGEIVIKPSQIISWLFKV